jgi:hypothetical protein
MKKAVLLFTTVFALALSVQSFAQEKKQLIEVANDNNRSEFKFDSEEFNFGTIKSGEKVTHEFTFTNIGNQPLVIMKAEGSCGCTVPEYPKEPIQKNQKGKIKVTFDSSGKSGTQHKTVTITSNAVQESMVLNIKGTIESAPVEKPKTNSTK